MGDQAWGGWLSAASQYSAQVGKDSGSRRAPSGSLAIIDADGIHALTIAAPARGMAMSASAVYRYFPSRDALVAHLVTLSYQQLVAAMSQAGGREQAGASRATTAAGCPVRRLGSAAPAPLRDAFR
ncbi:TetR/AcrR family transcriptional regulator [Streptomyces canus]|uniref:TetR/AcrR family transcriptional regulator n=1 Tax=Streptomyces canus TaxID=58343 RepID=UPI0033AFAA67